MSKKHVAYIEMVIASVLWSIAGIFIKLIDANPFTIAGLRSLVAIVPVVVIMLFKRERPAVNRNIILGGLFLMLTFFSFVVANKLTTAANAIVLQFVSPIFIVLINTFILKERMKLIDILAVVLTFIGIAFFFLDELSGGNLLGNIIAVLSGLFLGSMFVMVGKAGPEQKMSPILFGHIFAMITGLLVGAILPNFSGKIPAGLTASFNIDALGWVSLFILGIFQLGIPYVLVGMASKNCPPLACSLISVIEPMLNPVWVAMFDGEKPGMFALVGAIIIIISVSGWCILSEKQSKRYKNRTINL